VIQMVDISNWKCRYQQVK